VLPAGEPEWLLYELDEAADQVTRSIQMFPGGKVDRNSIEIEERNGDSCPSLWGVSIIEGLEGLSPSEISASEFEEAWRTGIDAPVWNP
jgi:hypothetical protein